MAVEATIPTLSIVTVTALIDSINPCAIGVLILMLSVLMTGNKSNGRILYLGSVYILSVLSVYLLAGLGLLYFLAGIPLYLTEYLAIAVGLIIISAGLVEIKDFYWYAKGFSLNIPYKFAKRIHSLSKKTTTLGIAFLGAFVSAVELPCTGAPYLAIITMLSQYFDFTAFMLLVLYNIIFVSPLIVILIMVVMGKRLYDIKKWKQSNKAYMRLAIGLILIFMGWLLILISNGTINLG
jgi:cytochrome c biogenesis protein CcdA